MRAPVGFLHYPTAASGFITAMIDVKTSIVDCGESWILVQLKGPWIERHTLQLLRNLTHSLHKIILFREISYIVLVSC